MTQYSLKRRLKEIGARGGNSVKKELSQLHNMHTFILQDPSEITREMKQNSISSLMFLKERINGDVKSRACANISKQCTYIKKEDTTSPTKCMEGVFLTSFIEAYEERAVVIFNIPGAFLHTETNQDIIMILEGPLDEIIVLVDLSLYCRYINKNSKGNPLLYVKMCKALYGILRSALLFYRKMVKNLE